MEDEIFVDAPNPAFSSRKPPGMSPLQTGLLYGGAASSVMGPAGILVGLGYGILSKRLREDWLDKETAFTENTRAEHQAFKDELDAELQVADPDEKRLLNHARRLASDGYFRLLSGDETGRKLIEQANAVSQGIMNADAQARKADEAAAMSVQRSLITTAAQAYRQEFQTNIQQFDEIETRATRVLDLVAQPDFDPNKPSNKAFLGELLSTGIGGFYKDAPDALDAVVQGSTALEKIPIVGQYGPDIVGAVVTAVKSKDFKMTAEDYNRVALNMQQYARKHAEGKMGQLGQQAQQLDQFARKTRSIPDDYSLADYVSGGVKELRLLPTPKYDATPRPAPQTAAPPNTPTGFLSELMKWQRGNTLLRPTN